ncbi:hypothetical protein C0J52_20738 [Blattella germanica]|nr:hypothetical protein C0J52_20738 [Blattella germanica]
MNCTALILSIGRAPYFKTCGLKEPNFNECAKRSAIAAFPEFVKGDPKYRIPTLDPMAITELVIQEGTSSVGSTLLARNCLMYGMKNTDIQGVREYGLHSEYDVFFPELEIKCEYNVSGRILLLPIIGHGNGTFLLNDVIGNYTFDYDLIKKKDGLEYAMTKNPKLVFKAKGLKIHLENLFNGDKFLGDNMNRFLNENWQDILEDLGPAISEALGKFIDQCLTNVFNLVPFKWAVPDYTNTTIPGSSP